MGKVSLKRLQKALETSLSMFFQYFNFVWREQYPVFDFILAFSFQQDI